MFSTIGTWALVLTMQTAGGQAPASNQQPGDGGGTAPRRLTVTYSDGTSKTRLLTPRGGSWTPYFPHRPDPPAHGELPLDALDVSHVVDGEGGHADAGPQEWLAGARATYSAWLRRTGQP